MSDNPLKKARELILSITSAEEAKEEISKFQSLDKTKRKEELNKFYDTAEEKAAKGDTKGISIILRVFDHFKDFSHDRMLLHYIAQAEANKALKVSEGEKPGELHHEDLQEALKLISAAFADANAINKQSGIS